MANITRNTTFQIKSIIVQSRSTQLNVLGNLVDIAFFRSMKDVIGSGYINLVESLTENGSFRKIANLNGMERIIFEISPTGSSQSNIILKFIIYAIDNVQIIKDTRSYTLRFTEPFGIANSFMRIGMKYSNMKCSEVVQKIGETLNTSSYTSALKAYAETNQIFKVGKPFDESVNNINFLVPMWHPLKSMLYFANAACTSKLNDVADCVLFTDHNGSFNLMSFASLFNGNVKKLEFDYRVSGNIKGDIEKEEEKRYNISQLSLSSIYNIQEFAKLGIFGKRLYEADLYTLAGSQNEKQLGVPQLKPVGDDLGNGVYPYKDYRFDEIKSAAMTLYDDSKTLNFDCWIEPHYEASPDHLYNIVYYNGANDKSEKVLETIIEPRDLRGDPVRSLLTYFKISIRIPLELELDVGTCFTVKFNDNKRIIDEIVGQKFVIASVAHYFTLINAYTMVEAFSIPSGTSEANMSKSFANA